MPVRVDGEGNYDIGEVSQEILSTLEPGQKESNIWVRRRITVEGLPGVETLDDDEKGKQAYWIARDGLIEAREVQRVWGGHGGSVRRLTEGDRGKDDLAGETGEDEELQVPDGDRSEGDHESVYYRGISRVLENEWSRERLGTTCVVAITAQQGKKVLSSYSNRWTRPDLTAVIETKWERLRRPEGFEVVTFEVKRGFDRLAIYEALSHSRRAHQAYALVVVEEGVDDGAQAEFCQEAGEVGVGVIVATKHDDFDKWEEVLPPQHKEPNLHLLDEFLKLFFDDSKWDRLGDAEQLASG